MTDMPPGSEKLILFYCNRYPGDHRSRYRNAIGVAAMTPINSAKGGGRWVTT